MRLLMYQRARENMMRIEQEINDMQNQFYDNNNENLEEMNKLKLDELFSKQMAEHLYKSEYNEYGGGCSICLENFNKKSKVSITICKHVFHYKCIKDWLYKNAANPKCPNCNKEVLSEEVEGEWKSDETKVIKVGKNARNRNILNNNLNFHGRNQNSSNLIINVNSRVINSNGGFRGDSSSSIQS